MNEQYFTITLERDKPDTRRRRVRRERRRVRVNVWAIAKYTFLTVAGIILFRAGAAYGLKERGYSAVGGEVFALLLPVLWYTVEKTARDFIADMKDGFKPKF